MALSDQIGNKWDAGITWNAAANEQGWLLSTLDQESPFEYRAYTLLGVPLTIPRVDLSEEPGEQTLGDLWPRSQHSWHLGAGQRIFDSPGSDRFRFWESKGVDIWTPGQLGLLKNTARLTGFTTGAQYQVLTAGGYLIAIKDDTIWKIDDLDDNTNWESNTPFAGVNIQHMTTDGTNIYMSWNPTQNKGINKLAITDDWDVVSHTLVNDLDPNLMEFVKGRLICVKNQSMYEITDLGSTTEPTAFYTSLKPGFTFSAITASGPAIYVGGYAGNKGEVLALRLTSGELSAGLSIGAPRSVLEFPEGELVYAIRGYLGRALLIGTDKGVRNAIITSEEGDLEMSSLIIEDSQISRPVRCFEFEGNYAWFGWEDFDGTNSGLGRIDLGTLAYASDIMSTVTSNIGQIKSIAQFGGRTVFSMNTQGAGVWAEKASEKVANGYLSVGLMRYNTVDLKFFRDFEVKGRSENASPNNSDFYLDYAEDEDPGLLGSWTNLITDTSWDIPDGEPWAPSSVLTFTDLWMRLRFTPSGASSDGDDRLYWWRVRAEPFYNTRALRHLVPIQLYDRMTARHGRVEGYNGYAASKLEELIGLYRAGTQVKFYPPKGLTARDCIIEDIQFKTYTPTQDGRGFGGICLLVLKELEVVL